MRMIPIHCPDIYVNAKYLHCPKTGKYDLLGQLLYNLEYEVPEGSVFPTDIGNIPPFTALVRGRRCITPLSYALLNLSPQKPREQVEEANILLAPYNIQLVAFPVKD